MTRSCTCPGNSGDTLLLNRKSNHIKKASCNTCGGSFSVDGLKPLSASMLSTVGLEVTNSINPDLKWNSVTKGRRSRKPVARNLNGATKMASKSPKRVGDFSGSDSDKFGETVSGECLSAKAEHVPIKKRRHVRRSPSPGPHSSSLLAAEDLEQHLSLNCSSDNEFENKQLRGFDRLEAVRSSKGVGDRVVFEGTDGELFNSEDFPGIALLAAAACISSTDDDTDNANKEELIVQESPIAECSEKPSSPRQGLISAESGISLKTDIIPEDNKECAHPSNPVTACSSGENLKDTGKDVKGSASARVDRLHWDLNTVMDAWDQPYDDPIVGNRSMDVTDNAVPTENIVEENHEVHVGSGNNVLTDSDKHADVVLPSLKMEDKLEGLSCSDTACIDKIDFADHDGHFPLQSDSFTGIGCSDQVVGTIVDQKVSEKMAIDKCEDVREDAILLNSFGLHGSSSISTIKEEMDTASNKMDSENIVTSENNIPARVENISSHEWPVKENVSSANNVQDKDAGNSPKTAELPVHRINSRETMSSTTSKSLDNSDTNSNEVEYSHPACHIETASSSGAQNRDSQFSKSVEEMGQDDRTSTADAVLSDSQRDLRSEEIMDKEEGNYLPVEEGQREENLQDSCKSYVGAQSGDLSTRDANMGSLLDDCHDSGVSQENHVMVCGSEMNGSQAGYESPYEDGELRGSVLYSWEENEIEDGEQECVDYESDDVDAGDYPGSEIVEGGSEGSQGTERKSSSTDLDRSMSVKGSFSRPFTIDNAEKNETGQKKESNAGSGTTVENSMDMAIEENADSMRRRHTSDQTAALSSMDEFGLKTSRGKLQSRIGGVSSKAANGKDGYMLHDRSHYLGGSYSRPQRDIGPEKYLGRHRPATHIRERDGGDGQWAYWSSKHRWASSYHGHEGYGHTRPRKSMTDSADKFIPSPSHEQRQSINHASKGMHRRPIRRRSPADRDDCFNVPKQMSLGRSISSNRGRGSSGSYLHEGVRDVIREDLHEDAAPATSVRIPHYLSRVERSFSPGACRGAYVPFNRRRSRSRSRSRSPRPWQSQRNRDLNARRQSRSPDFRSEARERMRMHFPKPSFSSDYGEGYMSPPRGRFSPHRNYRWVDERNFPASHLRHRRSPDRAFRRNPRFDTVGSSGRLKSDEYFRPMIRTGRYSLMPDSGRGSKFEGNCDIRRRDDRSDMIHRLKHSDDGGLIRQFRQDAADNPETATSNSEDDVRDNDRRDVLRCAREEKRSFNV